MEPTKLAGIEDWPVPATVKQVRSFLGFAKFYWKFIGHYADITKPLTNLTQKDIDFKWTEECQNTFDKSKPFHIESDASKWATGAVL